MLRYRFIAFIVLAIITDNIVRFRVQGRLSIHARTINTDNIYIGNRFYRLKQKLINLLIILDCPIHVGGSKRLSVRQRQRVVIARDWKTCSHQVAWLDD